MPTVNLSPVFNDAQLDSSGNPNSGGKLFTYAAGSSTKTTTYTSSAGTTAQANPIVLNSRGEPASPIWLTDGVSYKFVYTNSSDTDPPASPIRTIDNVVGVNDVAATAQSEWVASAATGVTYISATSFKVAGDQTTDYHPGRRIKTSNTAGTRYGEIINSSFAASETTLIVLNDSGDLDTGLTGSTISLGIATAANPSLPVLLRVSAGRLTYVSATSIKLVPYQGDRIMVKKSATWNVRKIPAAGISAANTNVYVNGTAGQNVAASTLYYVYLFDLAGVLTVNFSTTAHAVDADTGVEIKSGDASQALIGLVRTNASSQFADAAATRLVLSWLNKRPVRANVIETTNAATASTTMVELSGGRRADFLTWTGESVDVQVEARVANSAAGGGSHLQAGFDGTAYGRPAFASHPTANGDVDLGCRFNVTLAEGYHYGTQLGSTGGAGTSTYAANANITVVEVQG